MATLMSRPCAKTYLVARPCMHRPTPIELISHCVPLQQYQAPSPYRNQSCTGGLCERGMRPGLMGYPPRQLHYVCRAAEMAETPITDADTASQSLAPAQDGYYSIALEGCEYLFGVTIDGRLNLRDAYVMDYETGVYAQPALHQGVPDQPQHFQELAWSETFDGDVMMQKDPWEKVYKVYLVEVMSIEPYCLNLEKVYVLDHESRDVRALDVVKPTEPYDLKDMTLRIRCAAC
eukprot:jgi/Botrbrau1/15581/Bobra.33_1s0009.2